MAAEHKYTEGNLSFELLKGRDKAMLHLLSTCPDLEARLVLVSRRETREVDCDSDDRQYKRPRCFLEEYPRLFGSSEDEDEDEEQEDYDDNERGRRKVGEVCRIWHTFLAFERRSCQLLTVNSHEVV